MRGFLRVWQELDIAEIEKHLLVIGELSGECYSCRSIDLETKSKECPFCNTSFKYVGFRRKIDPGYLKRLKEENPHLIFIDFEDFKRVVGKKEAKRLLDI